MSDSTLLHDHDNTPPRTIPIQFMSGNMAREYTCCSIDVAFDASELILEECPQYQSP